MNSHTYFSYFLNMFCCCEFKTRKHCKNIAKSVVKTIKSVNIRKYFENRQHQDCLSLSDPKQI